MAPKARIIFQALEKETEDVPILGTIPKGWSKLAPGIVLFFQCLDFSQCAWENPVGNRGDLTSGYKKRHGSIINFRVFCISMLRFKTAANTTAGSGGRVISRQ